MRRSGCFERQVRNAGGSWLQVVVKTTKDNSMSLECDHEHTPFAQQTGGGQKECGSVNEWMSE